MEILLITLMILLYTMQNFFTKRFSDYYPGKTENASHVYTAFCGILTVIVCFSFVGLNVIPTAPTLMFAIVNSAALAGYNIAIINGAKTGPYSMVMVSAIAGGILLPALVNAVFFDKKPTWQQIVAFAFILFAVYLMSQKENDAKITNKSFFISCLLIAICNGAYGTILNTQQTLVGTEQKESMVATTFLIASLISCVVIAAREKRGFIKTFKQTKRSFILMTIAAASAAFAIFIFAWVLTIVDQNLVHTFNNSGVMLMSVIASAVFLKEKLSIKNIIGCTIMCIALMCVAIFSN